MHPWRGTAGGLLKETEQRTHVVTYRGDWVGPFKEIPSAPPVDVLPAVREGSHLLIPERGTGWIETDPEQLMRQVEERQRQWKYFKEVTRMVKAWARLNHLKIKNLAIDVMVLEYLPPPRLFETLSCGEGVARFFETAAHPDRYKINGKKPKSLRELCKGIDRNLRLREAAIGAREGRRTWRERR